MAAYVYDRLPKSPLSIRLLSLNTASKPPSWDLRVHSLDELPKYDAVSYLWGSTKQGVQTYPFLCSNGVIQIYANLKQFINQMASRHHPHPIWTDAICINQGSPEEKDQQIPLMKHIYGAAMNVIIWLGDAKYPNLQISPAIEQTICGLRMAGPGKHISHDGESFAKFNLPMQYEIWATFGYMLCSGWFKRVWCLQEVVLAVSPVIWYGTETISWASLREMTNELCSHGMSKFVRDTVEDPAKEGEEDALSAMAAIDVCRDLIRRNPVTRVPVPVLLDLIRRKGATNPRDKIFGILGLTHESISEATQVQVRASTPAVYADFGKFLVQYDTTFSMFSNLASIERMEELPSWCPNFNSPTGLQSLGALQGMLGYHAGFGIKPVPNTNQISVPGCSVDVVEKVEVCHTPSEIPEMHWRTLSADIGYSSGGQVQGVAGVNRLEAYLELIEQLETVYYDRPAQNFRTTDSRDYKNAVMFACTRRRFFSTKNGRVGLGPWDTKAGDVVCLFYSAPTPFLLRKEVAEHPFRLVGEAYVYGLMYGEGLTLGPDVLQHQVFVIA